MLVSLSESLFKPSTLEDKLKPFLIYKEAYEKAEEDYSNLLALTEMWKDIANREKSPEAYAMYERYSTDLQNAVNDFSKGLNTSTRKALIGLKGRYAKDIIPIAKADAAYKEALKYRLELKAKDPSIVFKQSPTSIDLFLHGNTIDDTFISTEKIAANTAMKSRALAKAMFSDPNIIEILGGDQYQIMLQNGATPKLLFEALANEDTASPYIRKLYTDAWEEVGADLYSLEDLRLIDDAIITGMFNVLALPTYQYIQNLNKLTEYLRQALSLQNKEFNASEDHFKMTNGMMPYLEDKDTGINYYMDKNHTWETAKIAKATGDKYKVVDYYKLLIAPGYTINDLDPALLNMTTEDNNVIAVSEDLVGGNILDYLEKHPELRIVPGDVLIRSSKKSKTAKSGSKAELGNEQFADLLAKLNNLNPKD